jgi:hypothetical protein
VGFDELDHPEITARSVRMSYAAFPHAKTLLSFVCRMNLHPIRSPVQSVAHVECQHTGKHVKAVAHRIGRHSKRTACAPPIQPWAFR